MKERREKHILVSVMFKGHLVWSLVPATKVGKHYKVSQKNIDGLLDSLNVKHGQTYTLG